MNKLFETKRNDYFLIDPQLISVEEGHNVRDFERIDVKEHIENLKNSIKAQGIVNPIECRKVKVKDNEIGDKYGFRYILIDGECRLRAVNELLNENIEIARIPVILEKTGSNEANRVLDMITANQSHKFIPIELAQAYQRFINYGWNTKEIAKNVGKSENHVKECLELLQYNPQIQQEINSGKITANNVRQIDKNLKKEFSDTTERKKKVEEILTNALKKAQEDGNSKISKFLELNDKPKNEKEVVTTSLENVLKILPNKKVYLKTELEMLLKFMKNDAYSIEDSLILSFSDEEDIKTGTN